MNLKPHRLPETLLQKKRNSKTRTGSTGLDIRKFFSETDTKLDLPKTNHQVKIVLLSMSWHYLYAPDWGKLRSQDVWWSSSKTQRRGFGPLTTEQESHRGVREVTVDISPNLTRGYLLFPGCTPHVALPHGAPLRRETEEDE